MARTCANSPRLRQMTLLAGPFMHGEAQVTSSQGGGTDRGRELHVTRSRGDCDHGGKYIVLQARVTRDVPSDTRCGVIVELQD